jgi:hypothetical protein
MSAVLTRVVARSRNKKTGTCAATYRTQASCPLSCPLNALSGGAGCYGANVGKNGKDLFATPATYGATDYADLLALARTMKPRALLRLNVVGDFLRADGTPDTEYIDAANELHAARPDVRIIAYTHAWRVLSPGMFAFPVNASCETAEDVTSALAAGWQAVIIDGQDLGTVAGRRVLTCLAERKDGTQCVTCGLCATGKRTRPIVSFTAHGNAAKQARESIARRVA